MGQSLRHRLVAGLLGGAAILATPQALSSNYSPPGLYEVSRHTLDNGFRAVLKPRPGARNVSFRLVVGFGDLDLPCGVQETAHLLEHLLFAGTSEHTETELDALIEDHGGYWNAETTQEATVYQLDIYSRNALVGLQTLHAIMTDSRLTPESVETARSIVHREMGGKPSWLRQWLRARGIGKNATTKAIEHLLPGSNFLCPGIETAEGIVRDDLLRAYRGFYGPANMGLIVVGDFVAQQMLEAIKSSFGQIALRPPPLRIAPSPPWPERAIEVTGTLAPLLGTEAHVGIAFRIPGYESQDRHAVTVLRNYLETRLFDEIRTRRGLSYGPGVQSYLLADFGLLLSYADVDLDAMDEVLQIMDAEIERLRSAPLEATVIERTKQRLLLQMVQGYESNAALAEYYVDAWHELSSPSGMLNRETAIENVTAADLHRLAVTYLDPARAATFRERPTFTYTQLYITLAIVTLVLLAGGWRVTHARARRLSTRDASRVASTNRSG